VTAHRDLGDGFNLDTPRPLDEAARLDLAKLPNVAEVFPQVRFTTRVRYGDKPSTVVVAGVPFSASRTSAFEGMQGRFFSSPPADEAILLANFAKGLNLQPAALIGQQLQIDYSEHQPLQASTTGKGYSVVHKERSLRVVGIIERDPYDGFPGAGHIGSVFISTPLAESLNVTGHTFPTLSVRVNSINDVEGVEDAIKKMGFSSFSLEDLTHDLHRVFAVIDLFLGIFGSLALVVASLGIVNTLAMAILERRREIGIMKAIGASNGDVKSLFFAEAGAMGAAGGVMGVLLGWGIGQAIHFGTGRYLQHKHLPAQENMWMVPWWLVVGAVAFSIVVTLFAGLYPAARAARLDPIRTLRHE